MLATEQKYTIEIVSDIPPRLFLGDTIAGGKITAIKCANDEPQFVSAKYLAEKLGIHRSTVTNKCREINKGTEGKAIYDREQAIILLTAPTRKRGRKRKN